MAGGVGIGMFSDFAAAQKAMTRIQQTVRPHPQNAEIYEKTYQVYKRSYDALINIFESLKQLR
jgi:sugar (pentulose or hexulose) kinase